jgi:UPF0755 protein
MFIRLVLYVTIPVLVSFGTYRFMDNAFLQAADSTDKKTKLVAIGPDMNFRQISAKIKNEKIVRYSQSLRVLAQLKGIQTKIAPGEYELSPSMTPTRVLEVLTSGKVFKRRITIATGMNMWEISGMLSQSGVIEKQKISKALTDPSLLARAGIAAQSFEGYLYPSNYSFTRPISVEKIIWTMLEEGEKKWLPKYSDQAAALKYSRHEILTIASLVQTEAEFKEDYKQLASVFHNRLSKGIKLQSESSVIYGLRDFKGQLTAEDLESPSPYNTFLNYGLPPGPICNSGIDAIEAALYPDETPYLFFIKQGSGRLKFLTSQREYEEVRKSIIMGQDVP